MGAKMGGGRRLWGQLWASVALSFCLRVAVSMSVLRPREALGLGSFSRAPVRRRRREPLQSLILPSLPLTMVLQQACLFRRMQTLGVELGRSLSIESPVVVCKVLLGLGKLVLMMGTGMCSHPAMCTPEGALPQGAGTRGARGSLLSPRP